MGIIVPALLVKDRNELNKKLARLDGLVREVQIDAVDGIFASPSTWPYVGQTNEVAQFAEQGKLFPYSEQFRIEADLMVENLSGAAAAWIISGASSLVLHASSIPKLKPILAKLSERFGYDKYFTPDVLSFGVALTADDDINSLDAVIDNINYVQCMGIVNVGKQGQPFDKRVPEYIREIRRRYTHLAVHVDGGVSIETAPRLLEAGVNKLIIGSEIWSAPDVAARVREFEKIAHTYGNYKL